MDLNEIITPRVQELVKADDEGRVIILPTRAQQQRFLVEQALQIKLYDWQVAYIWGNSSYIMGGRYTGKTLASVIRLCLSEGEPLHMYWGGKHQNLCDEYHGVRYYKIFRDYVRDAYQKFKLQGVPGLRTIYFSQIEAMEVK